MHIWRDFSSLLSQPGIGTSQDVVEIGGIANGGVWPPNTGGILFANTPYQGFSTGNICKQRGSIANYMHRTGGGVASSRSLSGYPCAVGAQGGAAPLPPPGTQLPEQQQFWSYKLSLALGTGGNDPNPPYTPTDDFGIFFFVNDGTSADSYGTFTPNNAGAGNCSQGVGLYLSAADSMWHYAVRWVGSTAAYHALDVDVPLPYGGLWPATNPLDFVDIEWRWFSGQYIGGGGSHALLINGKTLAASSLAVIGAAPAGAGFLAELPDYYGTGDPQNPNNAYGQFPVARCSQSTGGVNAGMCVRNVEYIAGPNLPTTY